MDAADFAQDLIDNDLEHRIAAAHGVQLDIESADNCAECGLQIDSARQIAVPGCQHCAECAQDLEMLRKRGVL